MKGIILYKSRYGSTKQFSEWLKEDTGFELYNISKFPKDLADYDIIILGSSVHTGFLSIKEYIINHWQPLKDKRNIAIMLTSGTNDKRFINKVMERSLPPEILKRIKVFPVGGRYLFNKMSIIDSTLIKMVAFFTRHPETKKGMLAERDEVNRKNLKEILDYIKSKKLR